MLKFKELKINFFPFDIQIFQLLKILFIIVNLILGNP